MAATAAAASAATAEARRNGGAGKASAALGVAYLPAAVTAALRHLLEDGLVSLGAVEGLGSDVVVSALPPDRVKTGEDERAQINLFLYDVRPRGLSAAAIPPAAGPDEAAASLAYRAGSAAPVLELSYLLSAYGGQDVQIELLLGAAMEVLRARPVLTRDDLRPVWATLAAGGEGGRAVLPAIAGLAVSGAADRLQCVKLSHFTLEADGPQQLWSALQSKLRPSLLYRAALHVDSGTATGKEGAGDE